VVMQILFALVLCAFGSTALARTWVDDTGQFRVEAEFVGQEGDVVVLRKADGTLRRVPLERLSQSDREFIAAQFESSMATPSEAKAESEGAPNGSPSANDPVSPRFQAKEDLPEAGNASARLETSPLQSPEGLRPGVHSDPSLTERQSAPDTKPAAPSSFPGVDWVRAMLVLLLAICAYGVVEVVVLSVLGGGVAGLVSYVAELPLPATLTIGLAVIFCLPASLILLKSIELAPFFALGLGAPVLLVSHFAIGSIWPWAGFDALVASLLAPCAIAGLIARFRGTSAPDSKPVQASGASGHTYYARSDAPFPEPQGSRLPRSR
jgi:hypothetical protein